METTQRYIKEKDRSTAIEMWAREKTADIKLFTRSTGVNCKSPFENEGTTKCHCTKERYRWGGGGVWEVRVLFQKLCMQIT